MADQGTVAGRPKASGYIYVYIYILILIYCGPLHLDPLLGPPSSRTIYTYIYIYIKNVFVWGQLHLDPILVELYIEH